MNDNKHAIRQVEELLSDVKSGFVPKKFRSAPFTDKPKDDYIKYLGKVIKRLKERIDNTDNSR
jgi:hypothetical protein